MQDLNVQCNSCGKYYYKIPSKIKLSAKHYCSKECQNKGQYTGQYVYCRNCKKEFYKMKKEISENNFCSRSCSASYNNTHKKYGTRRSKLEVFLEEHIKLNYPYLEIICNSKNEIGSELDFYFPGLKFAIELNGIVHYEPIYGLEKFSQIQKNDNNKFLKCHEKGIELAIVDTSQCGHLTNNNKEKYSKIVFDLLNMVINKSNMNK